MRQIPHQPDATLPKASERVGRGLVYVSHCFFKLILHRTYAQVTENLTAEDAAKSRSAGFRRTPKGLPQASELFKTEDTEE
ncbi:hypothetical protein VF04_11310 [Nostoc linckia z7]|uniref:Uncharacterized protein n=2 Tax=Nostoc linckia TaxID=92942 RepID=A0A9Q6EIV2_NOSLI|nr:hypothetical protein VF03_29205 [Nostoc linckia z2]PHJ65061.1 hypothetical protein VF05_21165 [Nostoc linckia z3]PHJ87931.1 hypothetical protein VF07_17940 [Nostoc linckia z6]PHJ97883.1 hypothetical protein VF04_11310 [Nostoc linckia z7]PHJ98461.1 hypothetical protein VF08_26875 [Nostoc linckia z8]